MIECLEQTILNCLILMYSCHGNKCNLSIFFFVVPCFFYGTLCYIHSVSGALLSDL